MHQQGGGWMKLETIIILIHLGTIAPLRSRKHVPTPIWIKKERKAFGQNWGNISRRCISRIDISRGSILRGNGYSNWWHDRTKDIQGNRRTKRCTQESRGSSHQARGEQAQKPIHVEAHDEDKGEDWDERDKVEYERNKQFEKLISDTVAWRKKWTECN